jgi:hypothetical protein
MDYRFAELGRHVFEDRFVLVIHGRPARSLNRDRGSRLKARSGLRRLVCEAWVLWLRLTDSVASSILRASLTLLSYYVGIVVSRPKLCFHGCELVSSRKKLGSTGT